MSQPVARTRGAPWKSTPVRLHGPNQAELCEAVETSEFLGGQVEVVGRIEIVDFTAKTHLESVDVEPSQRNDTALACAEAVPELGDLTAERRND